MSSSTNGLTSRPGFTLIELLVVISIIALLIGLLLPALSGAREAARTTACASKQKQLVLAFTTYASDYGTLPPGLVGYSPYRDWTFIVLEQGYFTGASRDEALFCPTSEFTGGANDYSVHPRLMPQPGRVVAGQTYEPFALHQIKDASSKYLVTDGAIDPSNQTTSPATFAIAGNKYYYQGLTRVPGEDWTGVVNTGTNQDTNANKEQPRFRHAEDTIANWAFVDGHVSTLAPPDVTNREVLLQP
jgi:prepilin-type N-terminal cleavage/methylation domain-containing protein/prepilin-type processing-associated H-X9-DG protein